MHFHTLQKLTVMSPDRTACWPITWIALPVAPLIYYLIQEVTTSSTFASVSNFFRVPLSYSWLSSLFTKRTDDRILITSNIAYVEYRLYQTLITSNIDYIEHRSHRTSIISNIDYIEHWKRRISNISNIDRTEPDRTTPDRTTDRRTNWRIKRQNKVLPRRQLDPTWPVKILKMTTTSESKVSLILSQPSDWTQWFFIVQDTAKTNEIWEYIDPLKKKDELPTLELPKRPKPADVRPLAILITHLEQNQFAIYN